MGEEPAYPARERYDPPPSTVLHDSPGNLLCVANFPANTGFAWTFIEGLFAGLAQRLRGDGVRTWVAYPEMPSYPETLRGSVAEPIELPIHLGDPRSLRRLMQELRRREVRTVYFCDRPTLHPAYALIRLAGVRRIIVHDHSSGLRAVPGRLKGTVKGLAHRIPWSRPDRVVAISDFVARRLIESNRCPPSRVHRIWNSVEVPRSIPDETERRGTIQTLGLDGSRPVVGCAARATPAKGVFELLRAFDRVWRGWDGPNRPQLLYLGDGPSFADVCTLREELESRRSIFIPGYVAGAADFLGCVDVAVVPSLWQEGFGLAALEPLARAVPVIASRVGGIPEIVDDGVSGLLLPPGDEVALASAILDLLEDAARARAMGARGRERALRDFDRDRQLDEIESLFRAEMGV